MIKPEISIITPVYNAYQYINAAVKSIMSQTYRNFEWIIVDDCSTDESRILLESLDSQYENVTVVFEELNRGPVHARNRAMKLAVGRYIAFLDIDDLWLPEKLEKQIAFMKENDAGLSYTAYRKMNIQGVEIGLSPITVPAKINSHRLKKTCSIMASSAMFDTEKTGRILQDTTVKYKDDLHFWLMILNKVEYAYGLQEPLCRLRIHSGSWTGNKLKEARRQWLLYREHLNMHPLKAVYYFTHYAIAGTIKFMI